MESKPIKKTPRSKSTPKSLSPKSHSSSPNSPKNNKSSQDPFSPRSEIYEEIIPEGTENEVRDMDPSGIKIPVEAVRSRKVVDVFLNFASNQNF